MLLRVAGGVAAALWTATPLLDVAHPLWVGLQATAWLGALLLILVLLPGWRSRVSAGVLALTAILAAPLLSSPDATSDLRVAVLNTRVERAEDPALHAELRELSPDAVVLAETTTDEAGAVAQQLGMAVTGPVAPGGHGVAVLAATSARAGQLHDGLHQMPVVPLSGATVIGVHAAAPMSPRLAELWRADLAALDRALARPGPVIAAGDFNASVLHPPFRELPGRDCTLPVPTWPMPVSVLHLDHVVVSGAECTGAGTFAVPGTDHRGVWADIALDQAGAETAAPARGRPPWQ